MITNRYKRYFLFLLFFGSAEGFDTLSQAQSYAQARKEFPPIENENVLNPRFTQFYKQTAPSALSRLMTRFGLYNPIWSPYRLERTTSELVGRLTQQKFGTARSLQLSAGTEIIIIGPLFGAFHSLVRILTELKKRSFIDEQFHMVQKNSYLIFTGDCIDGSPHTLETLTLVLTLLRKNPEQVIYMQGHHEHKEYWLNHSLKYELQERASSISALKAELIKLFSLLPKEIDIHELKNREFIRIRNLIPESTESIPAMRALIQAEKRNTSYAFHHGLALGAPTYRTTVWSVFSAPTELYRRSYDFNYDSFVKLRIASPIANSVITLYNREATSDKPFRESASYSIVTARQTDGPLMEVTDENTITLGSSMDLSRPNRARGFSATGGVSAAVNRVNQEGGINGKFLQVIIADDQYSGTIARANVERFMKETGPLIMATLGSPTLAASLDLIKEKKIYILFPFTGSLPFRDPQLTHIINFRASYESEAEALTYYAHKKLLGKDFAFFYQDDTYGETGLKGARSMLKKLGIPKWTEVPYQTNTIQVKEAVEKIKITNPDVIGLFSIAPPTMELMRQLGAEFLAGKKIFAISPLGDTSFRQFLDSMGFKVTFAQVVPDPLTSTLPIAKEYRKDLSKLGFTPDTYSFEGYIATTITADILKKIEGPTTMEAVKNIIEKIDNYQFKGLNLTYNADNRQLSNDIWLETTSEGWIRQNIDELASLGKEKSAS